MKESGVPPQEKHYCIYCHQPMDSNTTCPVPASFGRHLASTCPGGEMADAAA